MGRGNDPIFDIVFTDKAGNVIEDATGNASGYQMKIKGRFVGDEMIGGTPLPTDPILRQKTIIKSYDHVIDDLSKAKNERYLDGGVAVGKEQYAPFKQRCEEKYQELTTQAKALRKEGKIERATELEARAKRTKKLGDNLVKAKDTSKDAADSYMKPKVTTAKRVLNVSFKAGINQAEYAAVMSSVSVGINSIVAVSKGDMDAEEAIKVTAKSTAKSAATGFVVGAGDSMLRGYLGNSKNQTLEKLSRSNMPMQIARMTKQLSGSVKRVITGEIDTKQFLQEIGSQQAGMLVGSWGGLVGSTAVGAATKSTLLQAAGAAAGSTIALLVFSSLYQSAMQVYQEERMSEEHLAAVREFCRYAKQQMREEEEKLRENIAKTYGKRQALFEQCIDELEDAFKNQKADQFVDALSKIAGEMGSCLQFKNFDEFDVFMRDDSLSLEF